MPTFPQMQLALTAEQQSRSAQTGQRRALLEIDAEREAALLRIEKWLPNGQDVHKWLAEQMTDDPEHPVSVSQVHDWIARRNGRRPPSDMDKIVCKADEKFNAYWNSSNDYEVPKRRELVPVEVKYERALKKLARLGEIGEQIIRELGEPMPPVGAP
jgi:hypothetical protein